MEPSKDVISTLNTLIETSKNGEEGFRLSAEHAQDMELKSLLQRYADDCARAVRELQQAVTESGGKPETSGTVAGAVHRGWVNIRTAVTSKDDDVILEECERGEDHAKEIYQKALKENLPANVRALVQRQYDGAVQHHNRIRDLRNQHEHVTH
jgi:uncharacterized protein (TIGR02284 family)